MAEFKSWNSFSAFWAATIRKHRYFRPPDVEEFLRTVLLTSKGRETTIKARRILWRAQIGCDLRPYYQDDEYVDDPPAPHTPERMKPLKGEAIEGRVNPKGIPYLYLATHRDTALAEVRPWLGTLISVAEFKILRDLRVVNCSGAEARLSIYLEEPEPPEREKAVWSDIDRAFSTPVSLGDRTAEYAPTQVISDMFKANGFDGIVYRSALGDGHNVALFDLEAAEMVNCSLFEVKDIKFTFSQEANPYFIKKYYENDNKGST
ncbi:MAG TPA: RES family NAD+ phosphorylase [Dissulfurispiraceae bacterium]|nr:RES family NAD+ phosphorylase [Dissulfurispiraceae bacterium]